MRLQTYLYTGYYVLVRSIPCHKSSTLALLRVSDSLVAPAVVGYLSWLAKTPCDGGTGVIAHRNLKIKIRI